MRKIWLMLFLLMLLSLSLGPGQTDANSRQGLVNPDLLEIISVDFAADPYSRANYDPFVKMRVYNNSSETITRAYVKITVSADHGRFRLFTDRFVHIANGGMQPYSSDVWLFYPRGSSAMALKGLPRDATISAEIEKVFCPKKNSPWHYEHSFAHPKRHDFAW